MTSENNSEPTVLQVLGALSHALDLTEGQPKGHAVRTSMIARRLAVELKLGPADDERLLYACLLKDSGCSNNSARIHKIFGGDEIISKQKVKLVDWSSPMESMKYAMASVGRGGSVGEKLRKIAGLIGPPMKIMDEVTQARCSRGAAIALMLGLDFPTAAAIQALDEHWDGKGSPRHLKGEEIPLLARILCISQTLEVFVCAFGVAAGYQMLRERSERWFDPDLVEAARKFVGDEDFWESHALHLGNLHAAIDPPLAIEQSIAGIDQTCQAFATIIDAKSTFTGEHSTRVTQYAVEIGESMGFTPNRITDLRRASLLHDIGKLGVPNSILDKPGKLDDSEFTRVKLHPRYTYETLIPILGFGRIAELAANHHERLDGRGYWRGLGADDLDIDMRAIAVADVFDALSATRPYRGALPTAKVFEIMREDEGRALDSSCIDALEDIYGNQEYIPLAIAA